MNLNNGSLYCFTVAGVEFTDVHMQLYWRVGSCQMGTVSVSICCHCHQCISCPVSSQSYQSTSRTLATHC